MTAEVSVEREEARSKFHGSVAIEAKTIRLELEEGEAVIIVSRIVIIHVYLLEHMFVSLFDGVLQTLIDTLASSFGALIPSCNGDILTAEYTAYLSNRFCLLKRIFSVYFIMVFGFVNGIFNGVFGAIVGFTNTIRIHVDLLLDSSKNSLWIYVMLMRSRKQKLTQIEITRRRRRRTMDIGMTMKKQEIKRVVIDDMNPEESKQGKTIIPIFSE